MYTSRNYLSKTINDFLKNDIFYHYYELMIAENKKTNLTRIVDIDEVYYKHFYDSLILLDFMDISNKKMLDVGAGAGFPSLPLKIANPTLDLTIIDSLNKRINFLNHLTSKLQLNDLTLIHGRAEELEKKQYFDIVVSRAVANLSMLVELTLPFVKIGGFFIAYKSINYENELSAATNAINILGGKVDRIETYSISKEEQRVLIFIKKVKPTKQCYPRHFSKIKKQPL